MSRMIPGTKCWYRDPKYKVYKNSISFILDAGKIESNIRFLNYFRTTARGCWFVVRGFPLVHMEVFKG